MERENGEWREPICEATRLARRQVTRHHTARVVLLTDSHHGGFTSSTRRWVWHPVAVEFGWTGLLRANSLGLAAPPVDQALASDVRLHRPA